MLYSICERSGSVCSSYVHVRSMLVIIPPGQLWVRSSRYVAGRLVQKKASFSGGRAPQCSSSYNLAQSGPKSSAGDSDIPIIDAGSFEDINAAPLHPELPPPNRLWNLRYRSLFSASPV